MRPALIVLALAATALAGCAADPDFGADATSERDVSERWAGTAERSPFGGRSGFGFGARAQALEQEVGPHRALASLPAAAGTVLSVGERRSTDMLTQTIVLDGGARGQNRVSVRYVLPGRSGEIDPAIAAPTMETIGRELAEAFPGAAMAPTSRVVTSADGPIGIAAGRLAGATCVYAWQTIRGERPESIFDATPRGAIAVRVRLCRSDLGLDELTGLVAGLAVSRDPSRPVPVAAYRPSTPAVGAGAFAYGCDPAVQTAGVCGPRRAPAAEPVAPARERRAALAPAVEVAPRPLATARPVGTAASVPLPPGSATPVSARPAVPAPRTGGTGLLPPAPAGAYAPVPLPR